MADVRPKSRLQLRFKHHSVVEHVNDPIEHDLSAAAFCEDSLFLSGDETAGVDRLTEAGDHWGNHEHFPLGKLIDLPEGPEGEMEGLACDDGWLWVAGSHALKRKKPDPDARDPVAALKRMEEIGRDANRYFLGRFPLVRGEGGLEPAASAGDRRVQHVAFARDGSKLIGWLGGDPHLAPFLSIPSKENGFDVEGLAVRGLRVWLGLRGPVLRGWAVVLEFEMKVTPSGHLKPQRIDGSRRYRKHLLPAGGLGVRDLSFDGDDLLVLVGPSTSADGPAHVLRWKDAASCKTSGLVAPEAAPHVLELPYHGAVDHPEGLVPCGDDWLVVYDSPTEWRLEGEGAVVAADIWRIP